MFRSSHRLSLFTGFAFCTLLLAGSTACLAPAANAQDRQDARRITATPNVINVIAGNPGLSFSPAQLQAIGLGRIVLVPGAIGGRCITHLRYQDSDEDLQQVTFDDGSSITSAQIVNLGDFRERLQEAANFGHGVSFCVNKDKKTMFMLNIFPCKCKCDK